MSVRYRCRRARSVRTRCRCLGAGGNALAIATGLGGLRCGEESESEASRLSSNALANIGPRCSCSRTVASPERTRSSAGTRSAFTAILSAGAGAPHPDGIAAYLRTSSDRAPRSAGTSTVSLAGRWWSRPRSRSHEVDLRSRTPAAPAAGPGPRVGSRVGLTGVISDNP